jgi:hypothetical protein
MDVLRTTTDRIQGEGVDQASHPYKTTGKIIVLYISIFVFTIRFGNYSFVVAFSWMYSGLPLTEFKVKVLRSVPEFPFTFHHIIHTVFFRSTRGQLIQAVLVTADIGSMRDRERKSR